jgi:hypothetical protein
LKESDGTIVSIKELSKTTGFTTTDIIETLASLKMIKYWKGQYIISVTAKTIDDHLKAIENKKPTIEVDPNCMKWEPPMKLDKQK